MEVPDVKGVVVLAGTGPTQPVMSLVVVPLLLVLVNVPKNAKEVRTDPVLLLIAIVSGAFTMVVPITQVGQLGPATEAETTSKSLDVQRSAGGRLKELCANAVPENRNPATRSSRKCSQLAAARLAKEVEATVGVDSRA